MWPCRWRPGQKIQLHTILSSASNNTLQVPQAGSPFSESSIFMAYCTPTYGSIWEYQGFFYISGGQSGNKDSFHSVSWCEPWLWGLQKAGTCMLLAFSDYCVFNHFAQKWADLQIAIADIFRDNVSFLRSRKTTYFSRSLIGESLWLRHYFHLWQANFFCIVTNTKSHNSDSYFYGSNFLALFLSFAIWIWDGMKQIMVSLERWSIFSLCGFIWSYQSCILMILHRFQGFSLTLQLNCLAWWAVLCSELPILVLTVQHFLKSDFCLSDSLVLSHLWTMVNFLSVCAGWNLHVDDN